MKDLKSLADEAKQSIGSGVVAIVGVSEDGRAGVVVAVTPDLTQKFNAVDFVRVASEKLGGKGGGGRPDMAQAGGPDGAAAEAALTPWRTRWSSARRVLKPRAPPCGAGEVTRLTASPAGAKTPAARTYARPARS